MHIPTVTPFLHRLRMVGAAIIVATCLNLEANAGLTLSFSPVTQTVGVGGTAFVDLVVSGLTAGTAPALGGWGVDIGYDPSIVAISFAAGDVTFGGGLNPPGEPPSDQGSDPIAPPGTLNLFEVALLTDPAVLAGFQGDTFTLATLKFTALANGVSPLTLTHVELSDENGVAMTAMQVGSGEIRVEGTPTIPEPGTGVFAAALALVSLTNRRRK